jgi:hypothetical protein
MADEWLSALTLGSVLVALAAATTNTLGAQPPRQWAVRVAAGPSRMHENDKGSAMTLHLARAGTEGYVRVEGGLLAGSDYGGAEVGLELDTPPRSRASLFLGVGVGVLGEDGFGGPFGRIGAGVAVSLPPRYAVRASVQRGVHGGETGPNLVLIGFEGHFGRLLIAPGAP